VARECIEEVLKQAKRVEQMPEGGVMRRRIRQVMLIAGASLLSLSPLHAKGVAKLTAQDLIDIQQLNARYVYAVDRCTNSGYDYADLYTDDGTFGVATEWGVPGVIWAQGREALAKAGGGGKDGCRERSKTSPTYGIHHIATSLVIVPTATGAAGKSTLLAIGVGHTPTTIEWQGGYEDAYVKTAAGWRIKNRWHVWIDRENSIQFRSMSPSTTPATSGPAPDPKR
jgi:hypothetical protein